MDTINTDPALIPNRVTPDPLSPAVLITLETLCLKCESRVLDAKWLPSRLGPVLFCCDLYALAGDDTWVNAKACENGDPELFLRIRFEAMGSGSRDQY